MKFALVLALLGLSQAVRIGREQDEICDGDSADGKELEDEWDPNDDIVDDNGFVRNWGMENLANKDMLQIASQVTRRHRPRDNQALLTAIMRYSDEIANGDEADDKDLHEEEDMNDDVVDYNGQTNRGYGSHVVMNYLPTATYIEPFNFATTPRADSPNQQQPGEW